jgi:hypothetical protein
MMQAMWNRRFTGLPVLAAVCVALVLTAPASALVSPYTPDANTIHLFHLNEAAGVSVAANAGSAGTNAIAYDGATYAGDGIDQASLTTLLGSTGFSGFGNAANINATTVGLGVDFSGNGAYRLDDGDPASDDRLANHASIMGAGNAFTIEALVNVPAINSGNRQIVATDSSLANNLRGFQFRINAAGSLEFNFIAPNTSAVTAPIPTTGPNAFVANEWFHAAMAYDGTNARFYWTKVDASFTAANLIGGPSAEAVDVNMAMTLTIGNEARVVGTTGSNEGLVGLIDEVRISNVARSATQFIFNSGLADCDVDGINGCTIADFNIIKSNFFNTGMLRGQGDLTADGTVDFADFRLWKSAAGAGFASITLFGVPEPATALLLACGGLLVALVRRRSNVSQQR